MDDLRIDPAPPAAAAMLSAMVTDYLDEMGVEAPVARASVPLYFREPGRWPFMIRLGAETVGFALVRSAVAGTFELAEYSIVPAFRGRGLGSRAAARVFGPFPGRWQLKAVEGASRFWPRAIAAAGWRPRPAPGGWFHFDVVDR